MKYSIKFIAPAIAAIAICAAPAKAGTVLINVDPDGTTSNLNVYGATVANSGAVTWPSKNQASYRDYQFTLFTSSGTAIFDAFEVQLSANQRQKSDALNTLRATLWVGPIPSVSSTEPTIASSLVTVTTSNDIWGTTTNSYTTATLTGASFAQQTITTIPTTFFFRVWAEGQNSNWGFQTKMAETLAEFGNINMQVDIPVSGGIQLPNGSTQNVTTTNISAIPEPSVCLMGAAGVILMGLRRKRAAVQA